MNKPFRPLLAAPAELNKLKFPLMASPKLDGCRTLGMSGKPMSRSMKLIPNLHIQSIFESGQYDGLDGELIVGSPCAPDAYRQTSSAVMTKTGEPEFTFHVFDRWDMDAPFQERYLHLALAARLPHVKIVPHVTIHDLDGLAQIEAEWLAQGYEGVMLRDPLGRYKEGRSTVNEGILLKVKNFIDEEFIVVNFEELHHNENIAVTDELGYTSRSTHKDGKRPAGKLGALVLQHPTGTFTCGTGFTDAERQHIWNNRHHYLGQLAKVKHFAIGNYDKPRFPTFVGFRSVEDLSND